MEKKSGKSRGGQPGNKNAQRHGFYGALYTTQDTARLAQPSKVEDEQELVRKYIFEIASWISMDTASHEAPADDSRLAYFRAMLEAMEQVNSFERTILLARGRGGEIGKTILEVTTDLSNLSTGFISYREYLPATGLHSEYYQSIKDFLEEFILKHRLTRNHAQSQGVVRLLEETRA